MERIGYLADVAANGREVLQALERQPYDVVLMDMQMPEMDGLEATRHIHQQWPNGSRPWIIAMTANALSGDRERCLEAGMDDYVSKPVRPEELARGLSQCPARGEQSKARLVSPQPLNGVSAAHNGRTTPFNPSAPVLETEVLAELRQLLRERAPQVIAELIDLYFETARPLIEEMRTAIQQEDGAALYRAAHTLKPSSAHLGAVHLAALCQELVTLGQAGQLEGAPAKLGELEAEFSRVIIALELEKSNCYSQAEVNQQFVYSLRKETGIFPREKRAKKRHFSSLTSIVATSVA